MFYDRMADEQLPDWWRYPCCCQQGHVWGPGRVIVRWRRCWCAGVEFDGRHIVVTCTAGGCGRSWYWPPHDACEGEELRANREGVVLRVVLIFGERRGGSRERLKHFPLG